MANGTTDEKLAHADRIAEQSAKAAKRAEQNRRGTQNAIANLRNLPGSQPYREEMDSNSEVTIGKEGIKAKGLPPWAIVCLAVLSALVVAFLGWLKLR